MLVAAAFVGASNGRRVVGETVACWQASLRLDWTLPVGRTTYCERAGCMTTGGCVGGGLCGMSVVLVSTLLSVGGQCGPLLKNND